MVGVGGEGESFKLSEGFFGVDLNEVDEGLGTGGEGILPDDVVGEEPHDGCSEGKGGLSAERCGHWLRENGRMCREVVGDGVVEGVSGVSEGYLWLEDVHWVFDKEGGRKAVLGLCENEGGGAGEAESLVD